MLCYYRFNSCVSLSTNALYVELLRRKHKTRRKRCSWQFYVDWGISGKLIIFAVVKRGWTERKIPSGHCYISIFLSSLLLILSFHTTCLCLSGHSSFPCVQLYADRFFFFFLCLLSSVVISFFFSYQTGLWASLSASSISLSYCFLSSIAPSLASHWISLLLPSWLGWDLEWSVSLFVVSPHVSSWFRSRDFSGLCGCDPIHQIDIFFFLRDESKHRHRPVRVTRKGCPFPPQRNAPQSFPSHG